MRLIDADDLLAKVQENAPGFMDNGSTITKAFIMAMINTKSVAPTIDAVQVVRCKDCKYGYQLFDDYISCEISEENESGCPASHRPNWFCADGERKEGR